MNVTDWPSVVASPASLAPAAGDGQALAERVDVVGEDGDGDRAPWFVVAESAWATGGGALGGDDPQRHRRRGGLPAESVTVYWNESVWPA